MEFTYIPYDYFTSDWYQIARELRAAIWSEPYFDEAAGGIMMAAFSVPFYRWISGERVLAGIVTAAISLVAEGDHCFYQDRPDRLRLSHLGRTAPLSRIPIPVWL
jgi:hypothetical protein